MSQAVYIDQRKPLSIFDPGTQQATIIDNADFATVYAFRSRSGYDARMGIGFDVASGARNFSSFRVKVNGNVWTDDLYNQINSNPGSTTDPLSLSNNMRDLPEGAYVEIQGKLTGAGANYLFYVRPKVEYLEK